MRLGRKSSARDSKLKGDELHEWVMICRSRRGESSWTAS